MYCPVICPSRLHIWPQQPRFHQESLLHTRGHRAAHQAKRPCSHTCKRSFPLTSSLALYPSFTRHFPFLRPCCPLLTSPPLPSLLLSRTVLEPQSTKPCETSCALPSPRNPSHGVCFFHPPAAPSFASPRYLLHCTSITPALLCISIIQVHSAASVVCVGRKWPPSSPGCATQPRTESTR